jgi:AraC-like DNA-binding protein
MSYSSLYAKVKGLTGQTPQVFISTYRMNTAMSLLKAGELSVSEVAYKVGASSPFSFSREFKKHFGFPPSHVAKTDSSEEDDSMDK